MLQDCLHPAKCDVDIGAITLQHATTHITVMLNVKSPILQILSCLVFLKLHSGTKAGIKVEKWCMTREANTNSWQTFINNVLHIIQGHTPTTRLRLTLTTAVLCSSTFTLIVLGLPGSVVLQNIRNRNVLRVCQPTVKVLYTCGGGPGVDRVTGRDE